MKKPKKSKTLKKSRKPRKPKTPQWTSKKIKTKTLLVRDPTELSFTQIRKLFEGFPKDSPLWALRETVCGAYGDPLWALRADFGASTDDDEARALLHAMQIQHSEGPMTGRL